MAASRYLQDPVAVVGLACRLPGNNNSLDAFWKFLELGCVASNEPPETRFNLPGHYDGTARPKTMRSPGGMFTDIDPKDVDAQFFGLSRTEAIAMDPQQRQLLEVAYEGLENAGLTLEHISGQTFGCFVGSYASDYTDIQNRDPEDRAPLVTIGTGRAMLSNRISHFLNIKGTSMTLDTACSGSLVGVDVACRYLHMREISGAIVAGCNLFLSPEHNMDLMAMQGASTKSGRCHTFDTKADGYIKAEAVNVVILKRLDSALKDGDPIRAIIRGTSSNSDGWTPGIASPNWESQAVAIRAAYANAGITDLSETGYLECHGTGTQAGDPIEARAASFVFAPSRPVDHPLFIGSVKSNIGHSEPASGLSGLIKVILALEKGLIPNTPTFITPNPHIDFADMKLRVVTETTPWPSLPLRRASVNSFGYGGSNAHVVVDSSSTLPRTSNLQYAKSIAQGDIDLLALMPVTRPYLLVFSANDDRSLENQITQLSNHLINPAVSVALRDLAFTLCLRRTHHFHRAFIVATRPTVKKEEVAISKKSTEGPRVGYIFTGQGAQWSQMGKDIIDNFECARLLLCRLDMTLKSLPHAPGWSLLQELTKPQDLDRLRLPEFSQPLVTALQLLQLAVFDSWGIQAKHVTGHSSGEIAAACAAGIISPEEAIKVAYYRGYAASKCRFHSRSIGGMLAVGVGPIEIQPFIRDLDKTVQVACINGPHSITLSGNCQDLIQVKNVLDKDGIFARILQVDLPYHSKFMETTGELYETLLIQNCVESTSSDKDVLMYSTVSGELMNVPCDASYWKSNLMSPVMFEHAFRNMVAADDGPNFIIELGPSGALAGPITQIKKSLSPSSAKLDYYSAAKRNADCTETLLCIAGNIHIAGGQVSLEAVNADLENSTPKTIVDLPNYSWNHSIKYWHESEASKDWRFRKYPNHDLLGSKVLGTSLEAPLFMKSLRLQDLPWLRDHKIGNNVVFPAAAYLAMAIEALRQSNDMPWVTSKLVPDIETPCFKFRDVIFKRALILQDDSEEMKIRLMLTPSTEAQSRWYSFRISSLEEKMWIEHCLGFICLEKISREQKSGPSMTPLEFPMSGGLWYKAMSDAGYNFGTAFQKQLEVESTDGMPHSRSIIDLTEPHSNYQQSSYTLHPVCIDGCLQAAAPSLWKGRRSDVTAVLVPAAIESLVISAHAIPRKRGMAFTSRTYVGVGRPESPKSFKSEIAVYDLQTSSRILEAVGMRYHQLAIESDSTASQLYTKLRWKPDIHFALRRSTQDDSMSSRGLLESYDEQCGPVSFPRDDAKGPLSSFNKVIELVTHKFPNPCVLEVNLSTISAGCKWFNIGDAAEPRPLCQKYVFTTKEPRLALEVQEKYGDVTCASFRPIDLASPNIDLMSVGVDFDLIILRVEDLYKSLSSELLQNLRQLIAVHGYVLILSPQTSNATSDFPNGSMQNGLRQTLSVDNPRVTKNIEDLGFGPLTKISCIDQDSSERTAVHFTSVQTPQKKTISSKSVQLFRFSEEPNLHTLWTKALPSLGWNIIDCGNAFESLQTGIITLVLGDLISFTSRSGFDQQWLKVHRLLSQDMKVLWVTNGAVYSVTRPEHALIYGLVRTARAEDPSLAVKLLDVESLLSPSNLSLVVDFLDSFHDLHLEDEYAERNGIVYTSRVIPHIPINRTEEETARASSTSEISLHQSEIQIRLQCERLGIVDSLHYAEVNSEPMPFLKDHLIKVEIFAAGLNFKDVAIIMGIVPENEYLLGLEGAGIIRRVGKGVTNFEVGQRVVTYEKGTFGNRVCASVDRVHLLPDSMSYEEASTLACVYGVSIHGLFDLAQLKKEDRVLIHSGAGGVGIAAIQLCQYVGAEVYTTVGTLEKRTFLHDTIGIPYERIFSSRSTEFAQSIMLSTQGKGVDVILNSLTGEMLHASWRCIADGGTMIEIGKKDILALSQLSMEPFGRNASFRALDMSHSSISDSAIAGLLRRIFDLLDKGHIRPIFPVKTFAFNDIPAAIRYMRGGTHMGKIVISNGSADEVKVPVRTMKPELQLRSDMSYLIVGGLKGLCGSLAIFMARRGARNLVVLSRSGYADHKSQGILHNLSALGCNAVLVKGDVTCRADVDRAFQEARLPIDGIIQGAMVLRDKIFPSMSLEDFNTAVLPKSVGTWNLHHASLAQSHPPSFFTLLSSLSGLVGQKGQANYAAANTFLDAFAAYRQGLGLPACAVDLGVVEDVGYIAEHADLAAQLNRSIWALGINEAHLHRILSYSILQQTGVDNGSCPAQLITGLPVPQPPSSDLLRDARFRALRAVGGSSINTAARTTFNRDDAVQNILSLVKSKADYATVVDATIEVLNLQLMKILALPESMEPAKPLGTYGLDSLAAVEFRNWVRAALTVELTTLDITNARSLFTLSEKVLGKMIEKEKIEVEAVDD